MFKPLELLNVLRLKELHLNVSGLEDKTAPAIAPPSAKTLRDLFDAVVSKSPTGCRVFIEGREMKENVKFEDLHLDISVLSYWAVKAVDKQSMEF